MAPKVFLTGATGYIGGDILYALEKAHPEYEYTLLVRDETRGKPVQERYPKAKLVYGTLDSSDVIEKAAAEADIVVHTADSADNVPSAKAIAKGLAAGHSAEKPGYWLHVCGTGILTWYDATHKRYGEPPLPEEKYDDIATIDRILNLPDQAIHRDVDKVVLAANSSPGVKTAIVGPPCIYGVGRGAVNTRSIQVYNMATFLMENGYAPVINTGKTEWDNIHVSDVASLFVLLADATKDPQKRDDPEVFGEHGYYFVENGTHTWGEVARWLADEAVAQGFVREGRVETTTMENIRALGSGSTWGLNSKGVAARAKKHLGWKAQGRSLKDEIPDVIASEAKRLGIEPQAKQH